MFKMITVIITAAGRSLRMGGKKKEYLPLGKGTVLSETAKHFLQAIDIAQIVVTYAGDSVSALNNEKYSVSESASAKAAREAFFADSEIDTLMENTKLFFVSGGDTRQVSVHNALEMLALNSDADDDETHIVLVHDGARPFVNCEIIHRVVDAAKKYGAAVPAIEPVDTIKEIDGGFFISRHLTRSQVASVQTPQGFRFSELLTAHRKAAGNGKTYTDDSEIFGMYCGDIKIVAGDVLNKKITYASDLPSSCESHIAHGDKSPLPSSVSVVSPSFRVGFGYDMHRLIGGRQLIIGGVSIPFEKGEDGHSDGDVLLHAVIDALLGAAALGDIGSFFPPDDDAWKNADSSRLLQIAWEKVKNAGWSLGNIDCVVKLETPKLLSFREKICVSIAQSLGVSTEKIFVKAKTSEKLGDVGAGNAIEAYASCLIFR